MNGHRELITRIMNGDRTSIAHFVELDNKVWNTLKFQDELSYNELLKELQDITKDTP